MPFRKLTLLLSLPALLFALALGGCSSKEDSVGYMGGRYRGTKSYTVKGKTVQGTYEFDAEAKTVTIRTGKLGVRTTAHIVTLGDNMSFVFDADKLLSVVKTITGTASKFSTQAAAINTLANQFNGLMIGFELKKK